MPLKQLIAILSTFIGALPVIAGMIVFKKAGLAYRLFAVFLLYGFLTDLSGYLFDYLSRRYPSQYAAYNLLDVFHSLLYIYYLMEAVFFAWFIYYLCDDFAIKDPAFIIVLLLPYAWALCYIDFKILVWKRIPFTSLFTTIYKMIISLLAAWSLWRLKQKEYPLADKNIMKMLHNIKEIVFHPKTILLSINDRTKFRFLSGIFFYCFFTFFITSFIQTPQRKEWWFLHNIINILTSFIYAYAFLKIKKRTPELNFAETKKV